ncbi:ArsR/SmtB family transcription factor [Marinicella sediminis]|nr:metalloregulator ArsR/SmtB family transcription factor [Marinicella sediminis]
MNASEFYKNLADPTRLRCLYLLSQCDSLCVCDFMAILNAPQSRISRHFKYLRDAGLVLDERRDQWVHYQLHPQLSDPWNALLQKNMQALAHEDPFADDLSRLNTYLKEGCC